MTGKMKRRMLLCGILSLAALLLLLFTDFFGLLPGKTYTAEDFGIEIIKSTVDFNQNGIDDSTDILRGAQADAKNRPKYDGRYWGDGGYPPEDIGVCTDVVWRAFRSAGYNLRDMVDRDIRENLSEYPRVNGHPDRNIDFRRVPNLLVFFKRNAENLTTDPMVISAWQPGDIVVFGTHHVGIVSDKRNKNGIPYLIHNSGQLKREEDALLSCGEISGHFRFNGAKLAEEMKIPFESVSA
ncbi:MAG: DUF1287 domain-containing protein [Oscillospiraceae bacterium]|nr:DUF1287 domain-containing protein [Oscillospiraceae bacterium]MDY3064838.1 DUF1287 domain-containing protein [Oscillospiraceae bacterium]